MDAQDFRSLQEAYMDVVEGAAGDVAARAQKLANQRNGQTPERKQMYQDLAYKAGSRERDGSGSPRTSRFERSKEHGPDITPMVSQSRSSQETLGGGTYERGPKRLPKSKEKYRRQVATGVRAASSQEKKRLGIKEDIYDIILSHLLDEAEGSYGQTPKASAAYTALAFGKGKSKTKSLALKHLIRSAGEDNSDKPSPKRSKMTQSDRDYHRGQSENGGEDREGIDFDEFDTGASGPGGKPKGKKLERQKKRGISAESYDLYDIILSHLFDEGYADTFESAEAIMVNMSEDWMGSIIG